MSTTVETVKPLERVSHFLSGEHVEVQVPKDPNFKLEALNVKEVGESLLLTADGPDGGIGVALEFSRNQYGVRMEIRRHGTFAQLEQLTRELHHSAYSPLASIFRVSRVVLGDTTSVFGDSGVEGSNTQEVDISFTHRKVGSKSTISLAS